MADERVDVYDENMKLQGQLTRDEAHASGAWHRSIHCWIVRPTDSGYVLFQKRGRDKKLFPNALDISAAGHYSAGEVPQDGVREILEELGLAVDFDELIPLGVKFDIAKIGDVVNREFCDVYLLCRPEAPSEYHMDSDEVEGLVQMEIPQGLALFSGERANAHCQGVEWDAQARKWNAIEMDVAIEDVIPRIDPYYLKIFIMAQRLLSGEHYIAI